MARSKILPLPLRNDRMFLRCRVSVREKRVLKSQTSQLKTMYWCCLKNSPGEKNYVRGLSNAFGGCFAVSVLPRRNFSKLTMHQVVNHLD